MTIVDSSTFPLLPGKGTLERMAAFPTSIYKVDETSILYKYIDALIGDSGVGGVKKQLLISRLNQRLDTTFFSDLDRVFGNLGGIVRTVSESYSINPSEDLLTTAEWDEIRVKDAWYRARIKDFFAAIALGGTPDGIRKMVKAAIGVDTEIYELWRFQDYYGDIYGIADVETITNLIPNPSFEYGYTGLAMTGGTGASLVIGTSISAAAQSGTHYVAFNTGSTITNPLVSSTATIAASGSKQYTFGAYYYRPSANTSTTTANVIIRSYDSSNALLSTQTSSTFTLLSASRDRLVYTFTTAANTARVDFQIKFNGTVTTTVLMYLDAISLTAGTVQSYFDGSIAGYRWTGEAGNSTSIKASPIDGLSRLKVPSRNEIVIYPHKASLTVLEKEMVREMVTRLAPVDSVITIKTTGYAINQPIPSIFVGADSSYFQINSFVTGTNIQGLTEHEEPNATYRWLQDGVETLAPNLAFSESQEYSQYYTYSADPNSVIDSVSYLREDTLGNQTPEQDYKIVAKTVSAWSEWTLFDLADCPANYPGGKNGIHPTQAPALNSNGSAYVFAYTSQLDYVNQMKTILDGISGETRTFKDVDTGNPFTSVDQAYSWNLLTPEKGEYTEVEYRIPIAASESVLNSWQPDEAVANVAPVRASSVTSGWFNRPYAANKQFSTSI